MLRLLCIKQKAFTSSPSFVYCVKCAVNFFFSSYFVSGFFCYDVLIMESTHYNELSSQINGSSANTASLYDITGCQLP